MAANRALFPRGVDIVLTCGRRLAALPRSVQLTRSDRRAVEAA
jgi:alpha-D-ribose 1-methylphosphonate 5-triphosphate synthase subunit PhnH